MIQMICVTQGLEPFEFISIGSGTGSKNKITVPSRFWFLDKTK